MKFHFSAHIFTITVNFNQNIVRTNSRRKAQVFSIHCFQLSLFHENLTCHSTCPICSGSILDLRLSVVLATHIRQTRINLCPTKRREYIYIYWRNWFENLRGFIWSEQLSCWWTTENSVLLFVKRHQQKTFRILCMCVCVCVVVHVWVASI